MLPAMAFPLTGLTAGAPTSTAPGAAIATAPTGPMRARFTADPIGSRR